MIVKYYKWPEIWHHFPFQGPPKYTQIGIFGRKRNQLATLVRSRLSLARSALPPFYSVLFVCLPVLMVIALIIISEMQIRPFFKRRVLKFWFILSSAIPLLSSWMKWVGKSSSWKVFSPIGRKKTLFIFSFLSMFPNICFHSKFEMRFTFLLTWVKQTLNKQSRWSRVRIPPERKVLGPNTLQCCVKT
jgi:hypothetical protein